MPLTGLFMYIGIFQLPASDRQQKNQGQDKIPWEPPE